MLNQIKKIIFTLNFAVISLVSLISILSFGVIKANSNTVFVFKVEVVDEIQIYDNDEYQRNFYQRFPKGMEIKRLKVHEYTEIPKLLETFGINGVTVREIPSFNKCYEKRLEWFFKNPASNLLGAYFEARKPISYDDKSILLYGNYQYTLEDMLETGKYKIEIAYIFEKADKIPSNLNIHHIKTTIPFNQSKIDYIKNYLNINQEVRLNSYNGNANSVTMPLPSNANYNNEPVDVVYFDKGNRFLNPNYHDIDDLLKLANGADNVYIFSLTNKKPQMNVINHYVYDINEIKPLLKSKYNIDILGSGTIPSCNFENNGYLCKYIKNPALNLLGVYFDYYKNDFYPNDYQFTLQDMLQKH
ncbi:hypothetical protein ACLHHF_00520, partial [Candidatus Phytoplasma pyri]